MKHNMSMSSIFNPEFWMASNLADGAFVSMVPMIVRSAAFVFYESAKLIASSLDQLGTAGEQMAAALSGISMSIDGLATTVGEAATEIAKAMPDGGH